MRNFVKLATASAIAITAIMSTVAPAAAAPLKSWEETIAQAKAYEEKTGRKGGWTRGIHSDKVFRQLAGADGWLFGNILGDDDVLPRVTNIRKVIEASKNKSGVIVASSDGLIASNPMMCEIANQVKMSCGNFTKMLTIMSSTNPLQAELQIQEASTQLQLISQAQTHPTPVSYTHLTLPTIYSV